MRTLFFFILMTGIIGLMGSCKQTSGEKAETSEAAEVTETTTGKEFQIDLNNSTVLWEGSKPTGKHNGTVDIQEGSITVENGKLTGGSFVLDMNTITDLDLTGDKKASLESHLKGTNDEQRDDFFNVTKFPTAKFEITKVSALENDEEANTLIYGNLTIRDVTKQVGFKANVMVDDTGVKAETPQFTIDRTQWGVNYGSKKIFDNLKDNFVNDEIGLVVRISTQG